MGENKEDWEHEYPEGSLGWKINRKVEAIEQHALKSGVVFLSIFFVLLVPVVIEGLFHPFQFWREGIEAVALAQWHTALYAATLFTVSVVCFYFGVVLLWDVSRKNKQ